MLPHYPEQGRFFLIKKTTHHLIPSYEFIQKHFNLCTHLITWVIIKSRNHRWCPHIVSLPDSHWANETGLPVRPVSTDQVVMWRDRWALADRWRDDLENLPPFLGSGSSWQVLFHKKMSKRNRRVFALIWGCNQPCNVYVRTNLSLCRRRKVVFDEVVHKF